MIGAAVLGGFMDLALFIVGLVLLLGAGGLGWYAWRRAAVRRSTGTPVQQQEDWDADAALRQLVRHSDDLRGLYASLGYDLDVEARIEQSIEALKRTIQADIPDFAALWSTFANATLPSPSVPRLPGSPDPEPHPAERLLHAVIKAGPDEQQVRHLLNRAPMEEPVPYVEVLPVARNGAVTWRPVAEVTLVQKRPSDPERFRQMLEHLEALIRVSPLERSAQATDAVQQALTNLRSALERPEANLPLALTALEEQIFQWLNRAHLQEPYGRKQALDTLLHTLVLLRRTCVAPLQAGISLKAGTLATGNQQVQSMAAMYLASPWMQVPHLTVLLLTTFLELRLSAFAEAEQGNPAAPAGVLRLINDEIASGYYASGELLRRLRELEGRGLFVHSLVHALLELDSSARGRSLSAAPL